MIKILSLFLALSFPIIVHAGTIDYKNTAECQTAMDSYINESNKLGFPKGLPFGSWFMGFQRNPDRSSTDCINNKCTTTFSHGGCGVLDFDKTHLLYNLAKPKLVEEIKRLTQKTASLPQLKFEFICTHNKNAPAIKAGQCKLV